MDSIAESTNWLPGIEAWPAWILGWCGVYLIAWAAWAVRIRVRRGRRGYPTRISMLPRLLPLVGLAIAAGPPHENPRAQRLAPPRSSPLVPPPWADSDGWTPPRPSESGLPSAEAAKRVSRRTLSSTHPAIHPEARTERQQAKPLFERAGGRRSSNPGKPSRYVIAVGDTLWDIAQRELGTRDPVRVHYYWHKIFAANRSALGSNPDLIYAGDVIDLPPHEA